jgi:hypothetical protein
VNNAVKEILAAGGYVTVNTLGSGFSSPRGVALDGSGNVFVADYGNDRVKEILAPAYSTVNALGFVFPGRGTPQGVAVDGYGNVFVADSAVQEILLGSGIFYSGFDSFTLTISNALLAQCSISENGVPYSFSMLFPQGTAVALHGNTASGGSYVWGYWSGTDAGGKDTNKDATVTISSDRSVVACPDIGQTSCISK